MENLPSNMKRIILNGTSRDLKGLRGTIRDFERPQETRETSIDFKGLQGDFYGLQETSLQSN